MNAQRRKEIEKRWQEIDRELADIYEGKVTRNCDPATREAELLDEQDELEVELGEVPRYFKDTGD